MDQELESVSHRFWKVPEGGLAELSGLERRSSLLPRRLWDVGHGLRLAGEGRALCSQRGVLQSGPGPLSKARVAQAQLFWAPAGSGSLSPKHGRCFQSRLGSVLLCHPSAPSHPLFPGLPLGVGSACDRMWLSSTLISTRSIGPRGLCPRPHQLPVSRGASSFYSCARAFLSFAGPALRSSLGPVPSSQSRALEGSFSPESRGTP